MKLKLAKETTTSLADAAGAPEPPGGPAWCYVRLLAVHYRNFR